MFGVCRYIELMGRANNRTTLCPCGSNTDFSRCCEPIIGGRMNAQTAEALMRSRYSAYVIRDSEYLKYSWHPDTAPQIINLADNQHWLGLKVKTVSDGGVEDQTGQVEFVARYKVNGRGFRLHETSRFRRYQGRWVYFDGTLA